METHDPHADTADPHRLAPRGVAEAKRRRRPSGKPPPLPRQLGFSGRLAIALIAALVVFSVVLIVFSVGGVFERGENAFLDWLAHYRTSALNHVMLFVNGLGSLWTNRILRWGTIGTLVVFRRWRHLIAYLGTIVVVASLTAGMSQVFTRARPLGVRIIGHWDGFSFPSRPVAALAVTLVGIVYTIVPPGRPRERAKWLAWSLIAALAIARLYLALDHPSDVFFGVVLGVSIPILVYRWFTPNAVFPVRYGRHGRAAHLDLGGRRGDAIGEAVQDQLGLTVLDLKPFGLAGSGGSTPMLMTVAGHPDRPLFAKLYAKTHLRADRWYKLGRTILYGTLEDEKAYNSVRRLVQYEDYVLRVMNDAGIPTATSYGFVEITPESEYLLVTEFLEGGAEISEVEVTDEVLDDALATVRLLWDAGLAHRDVKPANILVRGEHIVLIDLAFGEIRPSPWRQAVDLANMMVVLAIRTDPDRVYEHALKSFSSDEIAEAFAATRSITMPSQSRALLRQHRKEGRDILARFRELAPNRPAIAIQRWSVRRIALTVAVAFAGLIAVSLLISNLSSGVL